MRITMLIFYLLLILLGISFAALNANSVQVNFYVATLTMPISVLMALTLGTGLIVGLVLFLSRYWRLKMKCLRMRNQLELTEKEIKNLRTMPLKEQP